MAIQNPINTTINGNQYEFSNILLSVNNIPITNGGFSTLNYDWTLDPGVVNTAQVAPTGRTAGTASPLNGSISLLPEVYDDFVSQVCAPFGAVTAVDFSLTVTMGINSSAGTFIRVDQLNGCRITGVTTNMTKGSAEVLKELKLSIMQIIENGVPAWTPGVA